VALCHGEKTSISAAQANAVDPVMKTDLAFRAPGSDQRRLALTESDSRPSLLYQCGLARWVPYPDERGREALALSGTLKAGERIEALYPRTG
jgi:hypothetical protein